MSSILNWVCTKSVFCKSSSMKGCSSQHVQVYVLRCVCPVTSKPPLKQHRPHVLPSSFSQSAPPLSRSGCGAEVEIGVLAVGATFWLNREKTYWSLLQQKQGPYYIIQDDLAFPCAEDRTKGIKHTKVGVSAIWLAKCWAKRTWLARRCCLQTRKRALPEPDHAGTL